MVIGIGAGVFPGSRSSVFGETRASNAQASQIAVLQQASERAGISNRAADPLLTAFVQPVEKTEHNSDLVSRRDLNSRSSQTPPDFKAKNTEARKPLTGALVTLQSVQSVTQGKKSDTANETAKQTTNYTARAGEAGQASRALFEPSVRDVQITREAEKNRTQAKLELSKLHEASKQKAAASSAKDKEENGQHREGIEPPTASRGQLLLAQAAYQKARMREAALQQTLNSQNRVSVAI